MGGKSTSNQVNEEKDRNMKGGGGGAELNNDPEL